MALSKHGDDDEAFLQKHNQNLEQKDEALFTLFENNMDYPGWRIKIMKKMICVLALFSILLSGCGSNNKKLYEGSFVSSSGEHINAEIYLQDDFLMKKQIVITDENNRSIEYRVNGEDQSELPKDYYAIFTYTSEYMVNILHYDQQHVLDSDKQMIKLLNDKKFLNTIPRTSKSELWSVFFEKALNGELDFPEINDSIIS